MIEPLSAVVPTSNGLQTPQALDIKMKPQESPQSHVILARDGTRRIFLLFFPPF